MKKPIWIGLVVGLCLSLKSLAGTFVSVQADKPSLKYQEGETAGFTITENSGYEGTTEVEVFFQSTSNPLAVTDYTTHKFAQTPALSYGPAEVIFQVYQKDPSIYVKRKFRGALLETFSVNFNVRYNDNAPPVLEVLPAADTVFLDDMPFLQVNYSDTPAGVDPSTFEAVVIDSEGTRRNVTPLFTVTANFATVQFDETHKLPNGLFFLETSVSDFNENKATQTVRFAVEIPVPTSGFYTGLVLDNHGQPVENAKVEIVSGGTLIKKKRAEVLTDADGKYRLSVDQGGEVLLSATKDGWTTQTKWVSGESGKDTPVQTFTIKPLDTNVTFISKVTGGTGSNVDGSIQFVVAPNSASQDISLNITQAKGGSELPGPLPTLTEFTFMGTMGPSGTTFSPPGLLKIKNEHGFPAGTEIVVGMFNEATGLWEDSGSSGFVSNDGKFVEYQLPHFSSWDANQPVVPPTDRQPMAASKTPDVAGMGVKCKGCRIDPDKGNLGTDYELPYVMRFGKKYQPVFTYWSQSARPLFYANAEQSFEWMAARDLPDVIQVEMSVGKLYKKVYYQGGANIPSDITYSYRTLMEAKDTTGQYVPTGVYDFNVNIGNDYKNSRFATALYFGAPPLTPLSTIAPEPVSLKYNVVSRSIVLNSRNSPFGKGWTMQGLEKLSFSTDDRIVWEDGSGEAAFFTGLPVSASPVVKYKSLSKNESYFLPMKNVQALSKLNVTSVIEKGGSLLVADCDGNRVLAVATDGTTSILAGTGKAGFSGDGGLATRAELACPSSLYPSYDGGLLIADKENHRIRKIDKKGMIQTIAGNGSATESDSLTPAKNAAIGTPIFVTEDKLHSVFFITGNKIRYVDPRGRLLTMIASANEDATAFYKAELKNPSEIKFDEKDNLIISDTGNHRVIQVFLQSGEIRVIAGNYNKRKNNENVTQSMNLVNESRLTNPISYVYDKKQQVSYILSRRGEIFILTRDGRVQKTNFTTRFNKILLSRNVGILGAMTKSKSGIKPYVSPSGVFSVLEGLSDGTYRKTEVNGDVSYFNEQGLLTAKTTLDGKNETFAYDTRSRLTTWTIPGGGSYTFSYDHFTGRLQTVTDPANRVTEFEINFTGQLVGIKNPKGISRHYGYSNEDLLTSETDEDNNVHQYVYSPDGLLSKEIYADGMAREMKPRLGGRLIADIPNGEGTVDRPASAPIFNKTYGSDTSAGGRSWSFIADQFGNVTESIDGLGRKTSISRDSNGLILSYTSPANFLATATYNSSGLPLSVRNPDGATTFEYTDYGRVSSITNPLLKRLELTYNAQGNVTSLKDYRSKITTMTYEPTHHLLESITDPLSGVTQMAYNGQGLLSIQENSLGHQTHYSYNSAGLVTDVSDSLSHVTHYEYDDLNRLVKIKDHENNETILAYSETGKLLSLTNAKSNTYSYTYNSRGWMSSYTNPLGQTETYAYDGDGLLIAKKRFDGSITTYTYDSAKQLTKVGAKDQEIRFNYDLDGRIKWAGTPQTNINRFYDSMGRMTSETQNGYFGLKYDYNADSTLMRAYNGEMNVEYGYSLNQVVNQIQATINLPTGNQTYAFNRALDDLDRPTQDTLPSGLEVNRVFNSISQVTSLVNKNNQSQILSSFAYSYDAAGRQTQKNEEIAVLSKAGDFSIKSLQSGYGYDAINRLVSVSLPAENFSYDPVGNRQYSGGSINAANQLLSDGYQYTYTYSLNGEMTGRTNTITGDKTEYLWNGLSQLIGVKVKTASDEVKKEIYYVYDGFGRRVKRQVVDNVDPSRSYTRNFYYDGDQIVEERDENNHWVTRYMNGVGIDDPLLLINTNGVYGYTKDGLGSIKELVKLDQQVPHQRYSYSSYGITTEALEVVTPDKKPIENRYAYTGRELEPETGLYYYRARYYDPELGKFLNEDPIGFEGGDVNMFNYVENDPVNFIDPTGLAPGDAFGTESAAGYDALNYINGRSVVEAREYAGNIYRNPDGSYSYTVPRPGTNAGSNPGPFTSSTTAFYHTHGAEEVGYFNNDFSPADANLALRTGFNSYLGTPSQGFKFQNGATGVWGPLSTPNSCPR